ncbi:unnamed protein product [Ectocarpus sp. 13 AM-2016]
MDPFKELLGAVKRIEEAIEGEHVVKSTMRIRMRDYGSVIQELQDSTPAMFQHERKRLQGVGMHSKPV